jgi:hypothetical protein
MWISWRISIWYDSTHVYIYTQIRIGQIVIVYIYFLTVFIQTIYNDSHGSDFEQIKKIPLLLGHIKLAPVDSHVRLTWLPLDISLRSTVIPRRACLNPLFVHLSAPLDRPIFEFNEWQNQTLIRDYQVWLFLELRILTNIYASFLVTDPWISGFLQPLIKGLICPPCVGSYI